MLSKSTRLVLIFFFAKKSGRSNARLTALYKQLSRAGKVARNLQLQQRAVLENVREEWKKQNPRKRLLNPISVARAPPFLFTGL